MVMTDAAGAARKMCFVVMPVTTPDSYAKDLRDPEHFTHVLELLFTPALEQAGYRVIPPKMLGAAFIHAEIIRNLEQADLVLADLSSNNANVFFELGVRTSLDRPVVLVKDKRTSIPFDLGPINVLDYDESIAAWIIGEEIKRLAEHVKNVPADGDSGNEMWKYFGLTKRGGPAQEGSLEAKVDLLLEEVARLRLSTTVSTTALDDSLARRNSEFRSIVRALAAEAGVSEPPLFIYDERTGVFSVHLIGGSVTSELKQQILDMAAGLNVAVSFVEGTSEVS